MSGGIVSYERYAGMDARSWTGKSAFTVISVFGVNSMYADLIKWI